MIATRDEIHAGLADIVSEISGVPLTDVLDEKSFRDDLDVDSLSMVEVVVAAEERFGVDIPDEAATDLRTVGDAIEYILASR
ncbi:acyl carrier protein [Streptomyces niveiscabiei]|uniref:acyl carrier protein n=1 Tax=Streptomyces niveiscabiei TaxID=164115 RepID=UPI0029A0B240|nr:acyl carrier protein [Streptomyces niveiscabiei]MDX3384219.1 acyl carrier protein [Streptomyces niveiscabiei]